MIPTFALIGRPNVGKSTLFNRLTRTRDALVADFPGLTRDRRYGRAFLGEKSYIVIDTGGISDDTRSGIEEKVAQQSLASTEEADIVFFIVDAHSGLTHLDHEVAQYLRRSEKLTLLVLNKADGVDIDSVSPEFWQLGLNSIYPVSATNGRGVRSLIEKSFDLLLYCQVEKMRGSTEEPFDKKVKSVEKEASPLRTKSLNRPIKLAVVGRPNVGKSTLINHLLGEERVVVYDEPGTTRDPIYISVQRNQREYILIDTAGVRRRKHVSETVETFSAIKTFRAIEDANVALLLIDARDGVSAQDISLLNLILSVGRSIVIAVNKWDGLDTGTKENIRGELTRRLNFAKFARTHFISALHGGGVNQLLESVEEAYLSATTRTGTPALTRLLGMATESHRPPLVRGRRAKLKYAHPGGHNPPIIIIHGNLLDELPESYKRYLTNYYRNSLKTVGTPVKLQFQSSNNPFHSKMSEGYSPRNKRKLRLKNRKSR